MSSGFRFEAVRFGYWAHDPVLEHVDMTLGSGLTLVVGPNGAGKSSLMKLAAGVEPPDAGRVEVDGHDLWSAEVEARRRLAYVPEHADISPHARIGEVIDLVCRLRGQPLDAGEVALRDLGMTSLRGRSVRELSHGQRRRALIAAAMVGDPRNLVLDEPLKALDLGGRERFLAWIGARLADGAAAMLVSHAPEPFAGSATRVVSVVGGRCSLVDELPDPLPERLERLAELARA